MNEFKPVTFKYFILFSLMLILIGCELNMPKMDKETNSTVGTTTKKNSNQTINDGTVINEVSHFPTPESFEVFSKSKIVMITVRDRLDLEVWLKKLNISEDSLYTYNIVLYMRSQTREMPWEKQAPSTATIEWSAQVRLELKEKPTRFSTLYGSNETQAQDGEGFQVIAVLVKESKAASLPKTVDSLEALNMVEGVYLLPKIRTAIVRWAKSK